MKIFISFIFLSLSFFSKAQAPVEYWLQARMTGLYELENGTEVEFWGYGDNTPPNPGTKVFLPGPILRFTQGDSAIVHFKNNSPEMHTIHFHGLDVNQANDGVGHTSQDILPNQTFDYKFKCTHAGTFLYHCHVLTTLHLAMGMYGTVIVDPPSGPGTLAENSSTYDNDYLLLASEFNLNWNQNPLSPGPFELYEANYFMINGKSGTQLQNGDEDIIGVANQYLAIRLANVSYSKVKFSLPASVEAQVVNSDGRKLPISTTTTTLDLYPGERFDILVRSTSPLDSLIAVSYFDMRNDQLIGTNAVPLKFGVNSIDQQSENSLKIWPNPCNGVLYIKTSQHVPLPYKVVSTDGQLLLTGQISASIEALNLSLQSGVYFFQTPFGIEKITLLQK